MTNTSIEYRFDHETAKQFEALLRYDLKEARLHVIIARNKEAKFVITKSGHNGAVELTQEEFLYIKDFAEEQNLDFYEYEMSSMFSSGPTRYYYHLSSRDQN